MLKLYYLLFVFCISCFLSPVVSAKDKLILAVHPYLSYEEIQNKFLPLVSYLSQKIDKEIHIRVGSDYQEHIEYIGKDKVDIAYMGPASYIHMIQKYGEKPVLSRLQINGHAYFQGNIIVTKNSNIKTLADLKGMRIAFGDPDSTMSYIVPHYMLHKAGVYTQNSAKHKFLHSHNNVAIAVLSGDFDAGAVKPAVFKKFENQGLRVLSLTPRISEHLFVARSNLARDDIEALQKAMLEMKNTPQGLDALQAIKPSITGLVKVSADDYDNLRKIIMESKELH